LAIPGAHDLAESCYVQQSMWAPLALPKTDGTESA